MEREDEEDMLLECRVDGMSDTRIDMRVRRIDGASQEKESLEKARITAEGKQQQIICIKRNSS